MVNNIGKSNSTDKIINRYNIQRYHDFFYIPFLIGVSSFIFDLYFLYIFIGIIIYLLIFVIKTELFESEKIMGRLIKSILILIISMIIGFGGVTYSSKVFGFGINTLQILNNKVIAINNNISNITTNNIDFNLNISDVNKIKNEEYIKSEEFLKLLKSGDCGEKYKNEIQKIVMDDEIKRKIIKLYEDGFYYKGLINGWYGGNLGPNLGETSQKLYNGMGANWNEIYNWTLNNMQEINLNSGKYAFFSRFDINVGYIAFGNQSKQNINIKEDIKMINGGVLNEKFTKKIGNSYGYAILFPLPNFTGPVPGDNFIDFNFDGGQGVVSYFKNKNQILNSINTGTALKIDENFCKNFE
ncbi:MAG: hypothetical protein PHR68_04040 [Candidatus Gracilibacteria bacterium]|nr:hypothetical protein [Candidatus Gracilibacteria bacterium]